MNRVKDRVAIITGGATGIGEVISKLFAKEGAKVIVNGYPEDPVNEVVDEISKYGGEAIAFVGDISEAEHAAECVSFAGKSFGRLDILIRYTYQQCRCIP